jgi:muconolactone delta-isomerase
MEYLVTMTTHVPDGTADEEVELEDVLASMPLRRWRTDQVQTLSTHPNDPRPSSASDAREFLTTFTVTIPGDAAEAEVEELTAREADRTRELAEQGHLVRLWMLPPTPGSWHARGLWRAEDGEELQAILRSLPMDKWMATESTPLTEHPSDPALTRD